ncbi:MAG: tRNA uracil 4-sulfurtransferase ThiI [Armatimonadota bacterium]|nr:tRNA uracil 4-sulfurtransferase ThiI [Armatimonadota bacterium]MDR7563522.1 tRNA uracil 4-sulfurtransferase ThiI [Armatimonadota bacterium]MDR7602698.1 tRNA uracil 4-sulfurtransferase ThiI [Armatimonadota bacterium]
MEEVILVRYGEIGLKGRNRSFFLRHLERNLRSRLVDLGAGVENRFDRFVIRAARNREEAVARITHTFGVVSASPALEVPAELEAIEEAAVEAMRRALGDRTTGFFRVSARRSNPRFPLRSGDLERHLGALLLRRFPGLVARMKDPEIEVGVEVREEAYVYTETRPGPGGLPVGTGGRAVGLLSGGIDSPVALWMMARRGMEILPLHFHAFPFTSERSKEKVMGIVARLATWTGPLRLRVAPFAEVQRAIGQSVPEPLWTLVMRRMMMRVAERLAEAVGARALVTGENLGQVASQTVEALHVIEAATRLPVLRPLVGMDKQEIVALAERIGTYELSILPYEDCCTLFVPRHPRTRPSLEEVEAAERALPVEELVGRVVAGVEEISSTPAFVD